MSAPTTIANAIRASQRSTPASPKGRSERRGGWLSLTGARSAMPGTRRPAAGSRSSSILRGTTRLFPISRAFRMGPKAHRAIGSEAEAAAWILSSPEAYCNTVDQDLLEKILPDFDLETKGFFRWRVEYSNEELAQILREKSGLDFGVLRGHRAAPSRPFRPDFPAEDRRFGEECGRGQGTGDPKMALQEPPLQQRLRSGDGTQRPWGSRKIHFSRSGLGAWCGTLSDRRCGHGEPGVFCRKHFEPLFHGRGHWQCLLTGVQGGRSDK